MCYQYFREEKEKEKKPQPVIVVKKQPAQQLSKTKPVKENRRIQVRVPTFLS